MNKKQKQRNKLNVFQKSPYKWWHFWDRIKFHKRDLKFAWQRVTRGYCDADAWDLDHFYLQLFVDSLTTFKENLHGAPSDLFNSETEDENKQIQPWVDYLERMIRYFSEAIEENHAFENPYKEEYMKNLESVNFWEFNNKHLTEEYKELREKYYDVEEENAKKRKLSLHKGFEMMLERFHDLWD